MTASQRRPVVTHLLAAFAVSTRRACRLVAMPRSRWYAPPVRPERDRGVRARLLELAQTGPRHGYRQLHLYLRREGHVVNVKRVYRLYRQEGLAVRHRLRKRVARPRVPYQRARERNARWAIDFVSDGLASGQRFRALTVVDEGSHESPGMTVAFHLGSHAVIQALEAIAATRGFPRALVFDNALRPVSRLWAGRADANARVTHGFQP